MTHRKPRRRQIDVEGVTNRTICCPECGTWQQTTVTRRRGETWLDCMVCGRVRYRARMYGGRRPL